MQTCFRRLGTSLSFMLEFLANRTRILLAKERNELGANNLSPIVTGKNFPGNPFDAFR